MSYAKKMNRTGDHHVSEISQIQEDKCLMFSIICRMQGMKKKEDDTKVEGKLLGKREEMWEERKLGNRKKIWPKGKLREY